MPIDENKMAFILRILDVIGRNEMCGDLWWRTDTIYAPVTFFINCSDLFAWGCADAEEITPDNLHVLEESIADLQAIDSVIGKCYADSLFCCRVRQMRPQGCCYPDKKEFWPLFHACGPEREVGLGNPY